MEQSIPKKESLSSNWKGECDFSEAMEQAVLGLQYMHPRRGQSLLGAALYCFCEEAGSGLYVKH